MMQTNRYSQSAVVCRWSAAIAESARRTLKMKNLSELIEALVIASTKLEQARRENSIAMEHYLNRGGMSWGYHGQNFYDAISEAEHEVNKIKKEIDNHDH